jgi:hypothetical protein
MKRLITFLMLLCLTLQLSAIEKTNLKVLYVGGHSDIETIGGAYDTLAHKRGVVVRTQAWKTFLEQYFTTVKAIQGDEYNYKMSYDYDVTIIDGTPKPLKPRRNVYSNGRIVKLIYPKFFPDDFDCPVITIAEEGETVGRHLGVKNDWYCLCLLGKAFNLNRNNPIFKGPYPVKITLHDQTTPEGAKEFAKMMGDKLPATTPMWTVHERDYGNTQGYKIGMVTREWGYLDSPDAEVISGGQCAKSYDAIAIGRHANFMTWGFAASPADMTDEAKPVFANAVVYMAKFKGHRVLARKLNESIATRFSVDRDMRLADKEQYEDYAASIKSFNEATLHIVDSLKKVKQAGGEITGAYAMYVDVTPDQLQPIPTYEEYLQQRFGKLYDRFGTDAAQYAKYYKENKPYFFGSLDGYDLKLDEDAKSLGIANDDKALLHKAIELWKSGKDVEKGKRILYRYTLLRYDNPQDFEAWLKKYDNKLFFTESGGWLWLVNDLTPGTPGNDYSVLHFNDVDDGNLASNQPKTNQSDPVAFSSSLTSSGDEYELTVRCHIFPGYHIYNVVSEKDPYIQTSYEFTGEGFTLEGNLQKPLGRKLDSNGSMVYEGDIVLKQKFKVKKHGSIKLAITYQACNDQACLMPTTKTVEEQF